MKLVLLVLVGGEGADMLGCTATALNRSGNELEMFGVSSSISFVDRGDEDLPATCCVRLGLLGLLMRD